MHPGIERGVAAPVRCGDRDACRNRLPAFVDDLEGQPRHVPKVTSLADVQCGRRPADEILYPYRRVARLVADVGDLAAIGRKTWRGNIEFAIGQRERFRPAAGRRGPQLVPLPPEVRRVGDAIAVR